ncbi:MAG: D-Ala-D-Ala carboxypeptidase family metallohydrolase [Candidatus Eisenbacteria bacterium]|nr:D-Ala-D-Ala carboxypeptidase family metallohydrolase [Candidatus Eisenbacteria bacterium]
MRAKQLARYLMVFALATTTPSLVRAMSPETANLSTADHHPRITASPSEDLSIRIVDLPAWRQGYTLFVLPGQTITLSTRVPGGAAFRWSGDGRFVLPSSVKSRAATSGQMGAVLPAGSNVVWKAPGAVGGSILILRTATTEGWNEAARIEVQVMAPFASLADGVLGGYRIGRYPPKSGAKKDAATADYTPPPGFLKLPKLAAQPIKVSPRFFLQDFACKQHGAGDRYVALKPELLAFLEAIVDRVELEGFRCSRTEPAGATIQLVGITPGVSVAPKAPGRPILIMSGYRTPHYNRSLGNVQLSRHQFGDAADIIVDSNGDQVMDDLNQDGVLNGKDAITLAAWIEELWRREEYAGRPGGLGVYNSEGNHGPFVHVDMRGVRARWSGNGLKWKAAENSDEDMDSVVPAKPRAKTIVVR